MTTNINIAERPQTECMRFIRAGENVSLSQYREMGRRMKELQREYPYDKTIMMVRDLLDDLLFDTHHPRSNGKSENELCEVFYGQ